MEPIDIIGPPSLGNAYKDAKNLAILLKSMDSGITTYQAVYDSLESKYGTNFKKLYLREVSR